MVSATSAQAEPNSLRHLPALDGLRGLAVLLVVIYHATYLSPAEIVESGVAGRVWSVVRSGLWCGVDLFFVLSGFLITRILLATRARPRYFRSFYARRTLRIFPLYYGVLVGLLVALPLASSLFSGPFASVTASASYQTLADRQIWLWSYTQNFLQAEGPSQLPGLGHFWSLAIEEQFYLIWPLVVWCAAGRRLAIVCLLLAGATFAARVALLSHGASPWAVFHWTFTRCDGLVWGALAATIVAESNWRERIAWVLPIVMFAAAGWLGCGIASADWDKLAPAIQMGGYTLIAMLMAAWVLRLASREAECGASCLHAGWLRGFGKYSYAIYIFHWPLCRAVERMIEPQGHSPLVGIAVQAPLVLALSFVLAWLSWHLWEKHWLKLKRLAPYD